MPAYCVYILYSESLSKFYVGYSGDFAVRLMHHNDLNRNTIWTRRGIPWREHLVIRGLSKTQALKLERHLKRMKSAKYLSVLAENPKTVEFLKTKFA